MTRVSENMKRETLTRPPRRWRNWWHSLDDWSELPSGRAHVKGEVFPGTIGPWPSKEVAEQKAADWLRQWPEGYAEWIGALPEGERP